MPSQIVSGVPYSSSYTLDVNDEGATTNIDLATFNISFINKLNLIHFKLHP